ncbi:hypothetical protein [Sorangium sp. So ce131]|uniref:hypothetical protein n=1 Tax=Sorangium sp. So ce131 TaxID=3133282 RepID=UPI003F6370D9
MRGAFICYVDGVLRAKLGPATPRRLSALVVSLGAATLLGCEGTHFPAPLEVPAIDDSAPACAPDQLSSSSGCVSVGIQGCAEDFIEDDGLCRPALEKCSPGTAPKHDEGCVDVGISGCAAEFMGADGCRPTMAVCPPGTFAVPQAGCVSMDGPDGCGEDTWGQLVEMPGDVHVNPGHGGGGGDGSRVKPFATVAAALAQVQDGGRIVLAEGDYDEAVEIDRPIELVGRCASKVTLRGTQSDETGNLSTIWIHDVEGAGVRGVSVASASIGLFVDAAQASVRDVHVAGASGSGVVVVSHPGAHLDLSRSVVQATRPSGGAGEVLTSVLVLSGASARLTENALLDGTINLRVSSEAQEVTAEGNLLEVTASQADAGEAVGALVDAGALRLSANALVHHHVGALVTGAGAALAATRNLIAAPPEGAPGSSDVKADQGARATLKSNVLSGACDAQLTVADAGTEVDASGNLFHGAGAAGTDRPGYAVEQRGGSLSLSSDVVFQAGDAGLLVSGGTLAAGGVIVEGTRASPIDPELSAGVLVQAAGATLTSTYVAAGHVAGVAAIRGARLELSGSLIEGTGPEERGGAGGVGLLSSGAKRLVVQRTAVLASRAAGVLLLSSPSAIEETLVRGVEIGTFSAVGDAPQAELVPDMGDGLLALGSTAEVSAAQVEGCARAGLLFSDSDGALARSRATGNRFGLVLQGARAPAVEKDNTFQGNRERDEVTEGDLPVPEITATAP